MHVLHRVLLAGLLASVRNAKPDMQHRVEIGEAHLAMLRWHCVGSQGQQRREWTPDTAHDGTQSAPPQCKYLDRMVQMTSTDQATRQKAFELAKREAAVYRTPEEAAARATRDREAYRSMRAAYCAAPEHTKLKLCAQADFIREYDASEAVTNLDKNTYLVLAHEAEMRHPSSRSNEPVPSHGAPSAARPREDSTSSISDRLTPEKCDMMLEDRAHLFRRMWARTGWARPLSKEPACWERKRDAPTEPQEPWRFFSEALHGKHCNTNWYEGNEGLIGEKEWMPTFPHSDAPALLGFDDTIYKFCSSHQLPVPADSDVERQIIGASSHIQVLVHSSQQGVSRVLGARWEIPLMSREGVPFAPRCVRSSINLLNLVGLRVPYNLCRNLEWQVCAAKHLLPGQGPGGASIQFSYPPGKLPRESRPFGRCSGWRPTTTGNLTIGIKLAEVSEGILGYSNDDIFYLETCIFSQICSNRNVLFSVKANEPFNCNFTVDGFKRLEKMLLTPFIPPSKDPPASCIMRGQTQEPAPVVNPVSTQLQNGSLEHDGVL